MLRELNLNEMEMVSGGHCQTAISADLDNLSSGLHNAGNASLGVAGAAALLFVPAVANVAVPVVDETIAAGVAFFGGLTGAVLHLGGLLAGATSTLANTVDSACEQNGEDEEQHQNQSNRGGGGYGGGGGGSFGGGGSSGFGGGGSASRITEYITVPYVVK